LQKHYCEAQTQLK